MRLLSLARGYAMEVAVDSEVFFARGDPISSANAGLGGRYEHRRLKNLEAG